MYVVRDSVTFKFGAVSFDQPEYYFWFSVNKIHTYASLNFAGFASLCPFEIIVYATKSLAVSFPKTVVLGWNIPELQTQSWKGTLEVA